MTRKISILVFLAIFTFAGLGCRKKTGMEPSHLIGNLYSGQSLQAVQRELDWKAGDWEVVTDQRSLSGSGQPATRLYEISKKGAMQYGQSGEIQMTFFNDELVSVMFYPTDIKSFRSAVEQKDSLSFSDMGDTTIAPSTRVWVGRDQNGRGYIGWIDKVRQAALDDWSRQKLS